MDTTPRPLRQERITELVTHLTGAPMDQARVAGIRFDAACVTAS